VTDRVYTADEADALLPELRTRLARIRDARQVMLRHAEVVRDLLEQDVGGAHPGSAYIEATETLRGEIEWLAQEDIVLRDPETGLVDFPGEREGQRVWLCWLVGEDRVGHWHPLDNGFASRRPL
jgi:hypothetical protein